MFDTPTGKLAGDAATWKLISERDAAELDQSQIEVAGQTSSYPLVPGELIDPLPYLPDVLSRGAAIRTSRNAVRGDRRGATCRSGGRGRIRAAVGPEPSARLGHARLVRRGCRLAQPPRLPARARRAVPRRRGSATGGTPSTACSGCPSRRGRRRRSPEQLPAPGRPEAHGSVALASRIRRAADRRRRGPPVPRARDRHRPDRACPPARRRRRAPGSSLRPGCSLSCTPCSSRSAVPSSRLSTSSTTRTLNSTTIHYRRSPSPGGRIRRSSRRSPPGGGQAARRRFSWARSGSTAAVRRAWTLRRAGTTRSTISRSRSRPRCIATHTWTSCRYPSCARDTSSRAGPTGGGSVTTIPSTTRSRSPEPATQWEARVRRTPSSTPHHATCSETRSTTV